MDIEKLFNKYVSSFDLSNEKIKGKYTHSFRVMKIAEEISNSLSLNDEDIYLAKIIGLLHDIGRFEQLKQYDSYDDFNTIDHADFGVKLLFEDNLIDKFNIDEKYYSIINKAIKNHNKYEIEQGLNDKELLHSKIIRDADKLDILNRCSILYDLDFKFSNDKISNRIKKEFYSKKLILKEKLNNINDGKIVVISYPFDFNYKYSFKYVKDNNIFNIYQKILNNDIFNEYFNFINKYIEERLELC